MPKTDNQVISTKSIIRQLVLRAVLFLPLCFFIWFYASTLLVMPIKYLLAFILNLWQADLFNTVTQNHYLLTIETLIFPSTSFANQGDKLAVLDVVVNPMIYGYGIAVIAALVLALPDLTKKQKMIQIVLGYLLVILIQTFGVFWEMLKHLIFEAGADAQAAILATGISANSIAFVYQISYLILPAVVPIAYWIIINQQFIANMTGLKHNSNRNFDKKHLSDRHN